MTIAETNVLQTVPGELLGPSLIFTDTLGSELKCSTTLWLVRFQNSKINKVKSFMSWANFSC
jgi:hypothetical protein